jgi:hypothetical protein
VPEQSSPLIANATYSWTLSLQCDPTNPRQIAFIRGGIQRVAIAPHPESVPMLPTPAAAGSDQAVTARFYAQQGLWYDAITILAQALQTQPANQSIAQVWKDLLERSGLRELQPPAIATQKTNLTQVGFTAAMPQTSGTVLRSLKSSVQK